MKFPIGNFLIISLIIVGTFSWVIIPKPDGEAAGTLKAMFLKAQSQTPGTLYTTFPKAQFLAAKNATIAEATPANRAFTEKFLRLWPPIPVMGPSAEKKQFSV